MIDPATRDIVQNVYIRRVDKAGKEIVNAVIDTVKDVKDTTHK
jgi:branched-chain amino acid transport system substrate-binding protein